MDRAELLKLRTELKLTQAEMADVMGVPFRTYQDLEGGKSNLRPVHEKAAWYGAIVRIGANGGAEALPAEVAHHLRLAAARLGEPGI